MAIGYKASATSDYNVVLAGIVLKLQTAVGVYQTMMGQGDAAGDDLTGTYPNPTIAADAVTNTKLANMATQTIKGRTTAGTGDPEDLTAAQVRTILNVTETAFFQFPFHARLTAVSGNPTPTAETSTVSTIYLTPYLGSTIALYDGSNWDLYTLTEISLALSGLTAGKNYDVFVYNNSGISLELSAAWTMTPHAPTRTTTGRRLGQEQ